MGRSARKVRGLPSPYNIYEERIVTLPPHGWHTLENKTFKLVFILQAESPLIYRINGQTGEKPLREGDALVVPCVCSQDYKPAAEWGERHYVAAVLRLDPRLRLSYESASDTAHPPRPVADDTRSMRAFIRTHFSRLRHLPAAAGGEVGVCLRQMAMEAERRRKGFRLRIATLLQEILITLARAMDEPQVIPADANTGLTRPEALVHKTRHFIEDNLRQPLTVADVAQAMGRSEAYLAAAFKRVTGRTVFQELTALRLDKAKRLLLSTEITAAEIGRLCGFGNASVFNRVFRRKTGMTPVQFRIQGEQRSKYSPTFESPE